MQRIILFDGECLFCDRSVQFIIKRDPAAHFQFASLQSELGQVLLSAHSVSSTVDSLVLIEKDNAYIKSTAALRIAKKLDGLWHLLYLCILIPRPLRDGVYNYTARNRYRWFGKKDDACTLPTPEVRNRFL